MLTRGGVIVKKTNISSEKCKWLKEELTVSPINECSNAFSNVNVDSFPVFRESESRFRLPRHFAYKHFNEIQNQIPNGVPINVTFKGELKTSTKQDIAVEKALLHLQISGGGILSLPTGFGKTCVALYILSQLSVKTLIIVHKEFLMNQWIERIQQFLPNAQIGRIQQNKIDIAGKDIVIGMLQSIAMKSYDPGTFETFGFTIIDETHHISSKVFSKALFNVCTKYMIGLSATPIRKDGLTKVLEWFIGDIFFSIERSNQSQVDVKIVPFTCKQYTKDPPLNKLGKINLSEIINIVSQIDERNKLIMKLIQDFRKQNRKIIILSDRRKHCQDLLCLCTDVSSSAGLYMGGMKQDELKQNESCDIIFATYSLAHEGLDIPSLDTLILSTPKTDIVQSCGRILRETTGKINTPLIVDICDTFGSLPNQARKRKLYYKKSGFNILDQKNKHTKNTSLSTYSFIDE